MANKRDRIIKLTDYFTSLGIKVNICKNKARGNKGIFINSINGFRIDISKTLSEEEILSVLLHEFAHFIHYKNDTTLKSLDFIFQEMSDKLLEELVSVTVQNIPKKNISKLYEQKIEIENKIKEQIKSIKKCNPDFKLSDLKKLKFKTKYYDLFTARVFLSRINSRISRLNKYYNLPSELFARFTEMYFTKPATVEKHAPTAFTIMSKTISANKIPEFAIINHIIKS